jgi:hypothetical protein
MMLVKDYFVVHIRKIIINFMKDLVQHIFVTSLVVSGSIVNSAILFLFSLINCSRSKWSLVPKSIITAEGRQPIT